MCAILHRYGLRRAVSDKYARLWPVEVFQRYGVTLTQSAAPKSDLYLAFLPLVTSRRVALLDQPRANAQLASLERRVGRGGHDTVDHPGAAHAKDDCANAIAGAVILANTADRQRIRVGTLAVYDAHGNLVAPARELNPATGEPLDQPKTRFRWTDVAENGTVLRSRVR